MSTARIFPRSVTPSAAGTRASRASVEPILKTEGLWKTYHSGKVEFSALRGVNFDVLPGEFVTVMGPSGCGKSTLLYVVGGLARATRGRVFVDGNDLTVINDAERTRLRRHKVGFIFQRFNLLPTLNASDNIAIAQHIHGDGFDLHRFDVVTSMLGLSGRLRHRPSELSGGEQQRVAIARALVNDPEIIFADEPTGNLDSKTGDTIIDLLLTLAREGKKTLLIVTHDARLAARGDRTLQIVDGVLE